MANHLYGYSSSSYGGGGAATNSLYSSHSIADSYLSTDSSLRGTSSRYLSADPSSAASSSSMAYNLESYPITVPGFSATTPTLSYGPPGVDAESTITSAGSLYAGLKRTASESLYHQTLMGPHSTIGQTEAWYSTNPLAKRFRYESTGHLPIYPQRPGERDCAYYMQTRTCKYGDGCKFDHPIWVPEGGIPDWKEVLPATSDSLPERPGEPDCPYFLKTQRCKFGIKCKFNHPKDSIALPENSDVSVLPERPSEPTCVFYMKTGKCNFGITCKFHHPKDVQLQSTGEENEAANKMLGDAKPVQPPSTPALFHNTKGLPIRLGVEDCPFYLKTGSCKYGNTCRYNHPERIVSTAVSLLPTYDPRLTPTMLRLGPTIYPQRPEEPECDYYMKTGICKFVNSCKFHHPIDHSAPTASYKESLQQNVKLTLAGLPRREGAIHCPYYMKTGACKYGATCRFDHPPPAEVMAMATSQGGASSSAVSVANEDGENI